MLFFLAGFENVRALSIFEPSFVVYSTVMCCGFFQKNLEGQLALLIPKQPGDGETRIDIQKISEDPANGK